MLHAQSYGIYFGLYGVLASLLNNLVCAKYPVGYDELIGWMGCGTCLSGMLSTVLIGCILDR